MKEISVEKIKAWLSSQILAYRVSTNEEEVEGLMLSNLSPYDDNKIHIRDARRVAMALGLEMKFTPRKDDAYPYEISFEFEGFKFMSIEAKEEEHDEQDDI